MANDLTPGTGTSEPDSSTQGTAGSAGEGEEVSRLRADNTRLRMALAGAEKLNQAAVPLVKIAQALVKAPGGEVIVEKLKKGEPLTAAETKKVEGAAVATPAAQGLTKDEVKGLVKELLEEQTGRISETVAADRKAAQSMEALDARATKELKDYALLKEDPQFRRQVNDIIEQVADGTLEVPPGEKDVWWFAVKTAHKIAFVLRGEPKKGKTEAERVAEAVAAGGTRPTSTGGAGGSEIPEELQKEIGRIRKLGTRTLAGRSFSNPRLNRSSK